MQIRTAEIVAFGDESNARIVTSELPDPGKREVQVAVAYCEFSGADIGMRRGAYPLQKKPPLNPGYTVAGTVVAVGDRVQTLKVGDRVACLTVYGGEATRANVPERFTYVVPMGVALDQAACLILDGMTAYQMLVRAAEVRAGQSIFVHGLSGSVGNALVRLARSREIEVFGTASKRNHAELEALGATPFDYANKAWIGAMRARRGVDAVFDPLGFESFDESFAILAPEGILVGYGSNLPAVKREPPRPIVGMTLKLLARNLALWSRKRTTFFGLSRRAKSFAVDFATLLELARTEHFELSIKALFALDDVRKAHRAWSSGGGIGSTLIAIDRA